MDLKTSPDFPSVWGWVDNDWIWMFLWTAPLSQSKKYWYIYLKKYIDNLKKKINYWLTQTHSVSIVLQQISKWPLLLNHNHPCSQYDIQILIHILLWFTTAKENASLKAGRDATYISPWLSFIWEWWRLHVPCFYSPPKKAIWEDDGERERKREREREHNIDSKAHRYPLHPTGTHGRR